MKHQPFIYRIPLEQLEKQKEVDEAAPLPPFGPRPDLAGFHIKTASTVLPEQMWKSRHRVFKNQPKFAPYTGLKSH